MSGGDNLGDHSATKNLALNDYELRLRGISDNYQSLVYNVAVNGPRLFGAGGGYLGTSNGTNALTWDNNGNLTSPGSIKSYKDIRVTDGLINKISMYKGSSTEAGNISIFNPSGIRVGYIGSDPNNMKYNTDTGIHTFNAEVRGINAVTASDGYNRKVAILTGGNTEAGNMSIFRSDGIRVGYIGSDPNNMKYNTDTGIHTFNAEVRGINAVTASDGYNRKAAILMGGNTEAGNLSIFKGDGKRVGYIGSDPNNMKYNTDTGIHTFNAEVRGINALTVSDGYNRKAAILMGGNTEAGNMSIFRSDGIRVGYIGSDPNNMKYNTDAGIHIFNTTVQTPRVQGPSDRRFKKDITPIYNATEKLNQLNGYTYTWKDKKEFPGQTLGEGKDMGVIAQEVEKVFPDAVMTNKEGYKSVNYNALIPVLIEALKESNKKIKVLEDRLNHTEKTGNTQ